MRIAIPYRKVITPLLRSSETSVYTARSLRASCQLLVPIDSAQIKTLDETVFHSPAVQDVNEQGARILHTQQITGQRTQPRPGFAGKGRHHGHSGKKLAVGGHQPSRGLISLGNHKRDDGRQDKTPRRDPTEKSPTLPEQPRPPGGGPTLSSLASSSTYLSLALSRDLRRSKRPRPIDSFVCFTPGSVAMLCGD
jgi:hypothetical protein